jgi:hypothetical protein
MYVYNNTPTDKVYNIGTYPGKTGIVETISDVPDGLGKYNEVVHTKQVWDFPCRTLSWAGENSTYQGKTARAETSSYLSAGYSIAGVEYDDPAPSWDSDLLALVRACNKMQFGIQDSGINLPTFLGELRDFTTLFKDVGKMTALLGPDIRNGSSGKSRALRRAIKRWNQNPGVGLQEALTTLVTADLINQFAIKPFLGDLANLLKLGQHVHSQFERLERGVEHPFPVRGTVHDDSIDNTALTPVYNKSFRALLRQRLVTAWARVLLHLPSGFPSPPAIMASALGFDDPHLVSWELTRWSFVVDYFVNVGDWLAQFKGDLCDIPYTILDQGYSVKHEALVEVTTHFDSEGLRTQFWNEHGAFPIVKGRLAYTRYRRIKAELPLEAFSPIPQIRLPNFRQFANLTEILYLRR